MEKVVASYILDLVRATRTPGAFGIELASLVEYGASPRASLALSGASRAMAFLDGRGFVTPDDVKAVAPDVLRHRLLLTYEAEAMEVDADAVIQDLLEHVPTP
jgi:MoxR-like ATPase